jgi:hypothetical protein
MSARETPIQKTKRIYGSKEKLVEAVVKALGGLDAGEDDLEERLNGAPNSRLLRLADVAAAVKSRYGTKGKLVDAICAAEGKAKDEDYHERLSSYPLPRLLDLAVSAERRARRSGGKANRKQAA